MKKKVLLLAPPFMNIYKDIISGLESLEMEVVWVQDAQIDGNPYNKRDVNLNTKTINEYDKCVNSFWENKFTSLKSIGVFDIFLAIDGLMVSHEFFKVLRRRFPNIKTYLYLYDRVENNYELDPFFDYYDEIYTFEKSDAQKYKIHHLPIYFMPSTKNTDVIYDIFGLGTYKAGARYETFKKIKDITESVGLKVNISLYHRHVDRPLIYILFYFYMRIRGKNSLALSQLKDSIFTDKIITPDEFRTNISKSRVILDTHNDFQDGLTARFMWALGQEKKIITTNKNIIDYPFYDPDQIMILDGNYDELIDFVRKPFVMKKGIKKELEKYRIDNWLKTILNVV